MPLILLDLYESRKIVQMIGSDEQIRHLKNLGFREGENVSIVSHWVGNLIVKIHDSRIAISQQLASKILV